MEKIISESLGFLCDLLIFLYHSFKIRTSWRPDGLPRSRFSGYSIILLFTNAFRSKEPNELLPLDFTAVLTRFSKVKSKHVSFLQKFEKFLSCGETTGLIIPSVVSNSFFKWSI